MSNRSTATSPNQELTAQFDYAGATSEELSINKGDRLILLNSDDQQWWYVRNEATKAEGYIPRSYVLQPSPVSSPQKLVVNSNHPLSPQQQQQSKRLKALVKTLPKLKILQPDISARTLTPPPRTAESWSPSLFHQYSSQGNGMLSQVMMPQLELDGSKYLDLQSDEPVVETKCTLAFSIVQAKHVPLPLSSSSIVKRWVSFGVWDKNQQLLGNYQTVPAYVDQSNSDTWRFTAKSSLLFAKNDENTGFVRCDQLSTDVCLLFELGLSFYRNNNNNNREARDNVSRVERINCGWAMLPLFTPTLSPLTADTFELKLFAGSPLDGQSVQLKSSGGCSSQATKSPLKALFRSPVTDQPAILSVRVWKLTDEYEENLEKLPRTMCSMLSHAPLLAMVRELLFEALVGPNGSGGQPAVGSIYSPSLSVFYRIADRPLILQKLADQWNRSLKKSSRNERKSMEIMKQKFAEITANLWPALDIVAVRSDNQEVNNCPLGLLSDDHALLPKYHLNSGVKNFGFNPQSFAYQPFDTQQVYLNPIQSSQ